MGNVIDHNVTQGLEDIEMLGKDSGSEDNELISHFMLSFKAGETFLNNFCVFICDWHCGFVFAEVVGGYSVFHGHVVSPVYGFVGSVW